MTVQASLTALRLRSGAARSDAPVAHEAASRVEDRKYLSAVLRQRGSVGEGARHDGAMTIVLERLPEDGPLELWGGGTGSGLVSGGPGPRVERRGARA